MTHYFINGNYIYHIYYNYIWCQIKQIANININALKYEINCLVTCDKNYHWKIHSVQILVLKKER